MINNISYNLTNLVQEQTVCITNFPERLPIELILLCYFCIGLTLTLFIYINNKYRVKGYDKYFFIITISVIASVCLSVIFYDEVIRAATQAIT